MSTFGIGINAEANDSGEIKVKCNHIAVRRGLQPAVI